jgi:hypothetical protein
VPINTSHDAYHHGYAGRSSGRSLKPNITFYLPAFRNALEIQARRANGTFTSIHAAVQRANARSLTFIQQQAAKALDEAIAHHGRPQTHNSGNLREAILDPKYSSSNVDGFRFLEDTKIQHEVPYYRAIEEGSHHFVGRRIVLNFLDPGGGAHPRSTGLRNDPVLGIAHPRRKDAVIGPRQRLASGNQDWKDSAVGVVIRNPIPAYHYGQKAYDAFVTQKIHRTYVTEEIRKDPKLARFLVD